MFLPCYNGGLADACAAEHNETVAIARWRLASVLLRRRGRGARADGHREHSILRGRGTLTLHQLRLRSRSSPAASVDPMLGGLVGRTRASAEPLHAAQKSAARLQLRKPITAITVGASAGINPEIPLAPFSLCLLPYSRLPLPGRTHLRRPEPPPESPPPRCAFRLCRNETRSSLHPTCHKHTYTHAHTYVYICVCSAT